MTAGEEEDGDEEISQGIVIFRLEVLTDTDDSVYVLIGEDNVIAIVEEMQLKLSKVSYKSIFPLQTEFIRWVIKFPKV